MKVGRIVVATISVLTLIGIALLAACGPVGNPSTGHDGTRNAPRAVSHTSVTLLLLAKGDAATRVTYTCVRGDRVRECGPERVPAADVWSTTVTVPAGTTVRLFADGGALPPWCEITDPSGTQVLSTNHVTGDCIRVAE